MDWRYRVQILQDPDFCLFYSLSSPVSLSHLIDTGAVTAFL
ncbi:hypothetical protein CEV31_2025 [Brucella thiophenivorans]|uniref:Uncharacterized protein n=1 Tax=Brucella thiophenivorans TaxID=571255 RepID=A0A256FW81_9HYPH|nr:hypothetical protein CEV31_2025 [Brucella thiophenivorans]